MTPAAIQHNVAASRFETTIDGQRAVAEYRLEGDAIVFTHTEVPPALQGHGLASQLVASAVAYARKENKRIIPECGYVAKWLSRHP